MRPETPILTREAFSEPELGVVISPVLSGIQDGQQLESPACFWAAIYERGPDHLLAELIQDFAPSTQMGLALYDFSTKNWHYHEARVTSSRQYNRHEGFFVTMAPDASEKDRAWEDAARPSGLKRMLKDFEFLAHTELFHSIPRQAVWTMLNCLKREHLPAGQQLMRQGDRADFLYVLQEGSSVIKIEKDGALHTIDKSGPGEVVGEMALLTGEPRNATVEAETDVVFWRLGKKEFQEHAVKYPDFRAVLTELLADRLESASVTADRHIGRYLVRSRLGSGAWSIVYHGVQKTLNMPAAIKMLKHHLAMDEDFHANFINEARTIARFNHPNIVQVYDIEERFQTLFIVMELLDGDSLEKILKLSGPPAPAEAVGYLEQICSGLKYAHDLGVVHQDIKPGNVIVTPEGRLKILDFGLACPIGSDDLVFQGTVYYMAPEQIEGDVIDVRTDIYGMGITAFEMLTGKRPYPEDDIARLMDLHVEQDIPDPTELAPGLPEFLAAFVVKACRRAPDERFQDMTEALEALRLISREMGGAETVESGARRPLVTLVCRFDDDRRHDVQALLEEFSDRARALGVSVKSTEFDDM